MSFNQNVECIHIVAYTLVNMFCQLTRQLRLFLVFAEKAKATERIECRTEARGHASRIMGTAVDRSEVSKIGLIKSTANSLADRMACSIIFLKVLYVLANRAAVPKCYSRIKEIIITHY